MKNEPHQSTRYREVIVDRPRFSTNPNLRIHIAYICHLIKNDALIASFTGTILKHPEGRVILVDVFDRKCFVPLLIHPSANHPSVRTSDKLGARLRERWHQLPVSSKPGIREVGPVGVI